MRVLVSGIPGVGKSTIARALSKRVAAPLLNVGDEIFVRGVSQGLVNHRDQLRKLPRATLDELRLKAFQGMAELQRFVLDSHLIIRTPEGFTTAFPPREAGRLRLDHIVLVEADPADILSRRNGQASRRRDEEGFEDLQSHQTINRDYARRIAADQRGLKFQVFENAHGQVDRVVDDAQTFLEAKLLR